MKITFSRSPNSFLWIRSLFLVWKARWGSFPVLNSFQHYGLWTFLAPYQNNTDDSFQHQWPDHWHHFQTPIKHEFWCTCWTSVVYFYLSSRRAFDVELLYIAQCFKIPIAEVAVNWTEIEGWFFMESVDMCPRTVPLNSTSINISDGRVCKSAIGWFWVFFISLTLLLEYFDESAVNVTGMIPLIVL